MAVVELLFTFSYKCSRACSQYRSVHVRAMLINVFVLKLSWADYLENLSFISTCYLTHWPLFIKVLVSSVWPLDIIVIKCFHPYIVRSCVKILCQDTHISLCVMPDECWSISILLSQSFNNSLPCLHKVIISSLPFEKIYNCSRIAHPAFL